MTTLRDYQQEIVVRVQKEWESHRSVMVQMPTGTGKTHVLASIVAGFSGKVLIVAHRVELVEQIESTVDFFLAQTGSQKTQHAASLQESEIINHKSEIKVSSIQTISRRIASLDFVPDLVIIDEAHHALAKTYRILWEKWPEAKFLGLTATPCRMNRKYWTEEMPVYRLMEHLVKTGKYKNLLMSLTDSTDEIVKTILEFRRSISSVSS